MFDELKQMFVPEFFNVLARVGRNARVDFQVVFWILRNVWNRAEYRCV